jgi:hypothetical protein
MDIYKTNFTGFFHWFAWTISIIASLFFLVFDVREDLVLAIEYHDINKLLLLITLLISITGCFYSVFNRVRGGIIMIAGGTGIVIYYYIFGGMKEFPVMIAYGLPYIIPGVFLVFVRK